MDKLEVGDIVILPNEEEAWLFTIISPEKDPIYRVLNGKQIMNFKENELKKKIMVSNWEKDNVKQDSLTDNTESSE